VYENSIMKTIKNYLRMGEIFTSYSTDKALISRIYKRLKKLSTIRTNNPINKWANEFNR
jgi:DNA replication protein DnaC